MEKLLKNSNSPENTVKIGEDLAIILIEKRKNLFLSGDLGAGKTTLLKGIGKTLGINENMIISPSFQLVRRHLGANGIELIHIDLYRLKNPEEVLGIGWWDLLEDPGITAVEWFDRAIDILPDNEVYVKISMVSEREREIKIFFSKEDVFAD